MKNLPRFLIAIAIAASTISAASAQSFSASSGTGNVLDSHYSSDGRLVADGNRQNETITIDRGMSAFAAAPDATVSDSATAGGSAGYNALLATH
jgi:hypothetical protein